MHESAGTARSSGSPVVEASAAGAGLCLFALFVHSGFPLVLLAAVGLLAAGLAIGLGVRVGPPAALLGLRPFSRRAAALSVAGAVLGVGLGVIYRARYGWLLFPPTLGGFVFPAALIGGAEELLYRGYMQGRARPLGVAGAVAFAASWHTAYKCCLFALPPAPAEVTIWVVAVITFLGGLGFGTLREWSGSLYLPLLAHAAFDIIVYGGRLHAPWWVWS